MLKGTNMSIKKFFDEEKRIESMGFFPQPMTLWIGSEACCGKASGFLIDNHVGIENVRKAFPEYKVYAVRESDELNCEPATIENKEVIVNFFGYFITKTDLDWCFKGKDWQETYSWDYDPFEM